MKKIFGRIDNKLNPYILNAVLGRYEFYSINDMVDIIRNNLSDINFTKIDCVYGIERSGVLPACIISLMVGKPLTNNVLIKSGKANFKNNIVDAGKNLLLVDDSIITGNTLNSSYSIIKNINIFDNIFTYVVFAHKSGYNNVDLIGKVVSDRKVYEWTLLECPRHYKTGFDLDDVLCKDGNPFLIPNYKIDYIITNRFEDERNKTVEWLNNNKIGFKYLLMKPNSSKLKGFEFKSKIINNIKIGLYVESHKYCAEMVYYNTNIPVLCIENMQLYS